ncbi:DUF309 domain-containing protein [Macrococcus equipercicus]|uniref:DUF309 domain-containing protein n=1 Tax=Macrococcus equipercicus TaxID=69967 RepID=A0ABQ6R9Y9_9STAP|nr:DUF309 domain-containing protein [Macrococcus equipercicus]KAA1040158.1 DUF309 domain-containing protein [Macrococcus equipercicus]
MNIMLNYYYQFLHERHYFECHELLEDVWKARPSYSKEDIEVAFIMLATSQYHHRRGNTAGAARCLRKAVDGFRRHAQLLTEYGVEPALIPILEKRLGTAGPYTPLQLPLTASCLRQLKALYPDFDSERPADDAWINFHATRDRSAVIAERERQLMGNKHPVVDPPAKGNGQ